MQSTAPVADLQKSGFLPTDVVPLEDRLLLFDPPSGQLVDQTSAAGLGGATAATSVVAADFDNDMDIDIYIGEETAVAGLPDRLYTNDGSAGFSAAVAPAPPGGPHVAHFGDGSKVISADYNLDGFVDLFINGTKFPTPTINIDGVASQLLKNLGNNNHWIAIDLVGVQANRDAIGARVEVTVGGVTQFIDQLGGKHRLAQNDARVHAGLGQHDRVDEIVVHWPSGAQTIRTDVAADQVIEIAEGGAPTSAPSEVYYLTTASPGVVSSSNGAVLDFDDSDIIKLTVLDNGDFAYEMYLDGSDIGLTANGEDIDAVHLQADGSLLISTIGEPSVRTDYLTPGAGSGATISAARQDLLKFTPLSLGQDTAGSWSLFLDGSAHGLTANSENIDAVSGLENGVILISTTGSNSVPGVSGLDEDILAYDPSSSTWSLYFDGGDIEMKAFTDDVNALSFSADEGGPLGALRMSSLGMLSVPDVPADMQDVYTFVPSSLGGVTSGTFDSALTLDGSAVGLAGHNITGLHFVKQARPPVGVGAAGDSLTDEYASQTYNYARNWVELLATEKQLDFGDQQADWGDVRRDGYEYNWGRVGATAADLISQGQHTGLAGQVQSGDVQLVMLSIGANDFAEVFNEIYSGAWSDAQVDSLIDSVVSNIETAVMTLVNSGADLVVSTISDYAMFPKSRSDFPIPEQRERISEAIARASSRIEVIASAHQIPLVDLSRFGVATLGVNDNVVPSVDVGGVTIANTAGIPATNAFVDDGSHPHTISQALLANLIVTAFNGAYGADLPLFSEQDIVALEGLVYEGDTFPLAFGDFVILPVSDDQSGPAANDVSALPAAPGPGQPIVVEAVVSDSFSGGRAIVAAEYFVDVVGAPGTGTPMAAVDAVFDGATEFVTGSILESVWAGLPGGQHTVFVRGQDADANWGPTAAADFQVPSGGGEELFYLTTTTSGQVTGVDNVSVNFTQSDILRLTVDAAGGYRYELHFDGSDVGLTTNNENVDALHLQADGSLVISTSRSGSVHANYSSPGAGSGETIDMTRQDLLLFTPASLGTTTTGSWSLLFDGSDHGLTTNAENIDAFAILPDGRYLISTTGRFAVPGASGQDRDLFAYDPAQDSWEFVFDGSDVGLNSYTEDINGLSVNETANEYSLTSLASFEAGGVSGQGHDVIAFLPQALGADTAGMFRSPPDLEGVRVSLGGLVIDGLHRPAAQAAQAAMALRAGQRLAGEPVADEPEEGQDNRDSAENGGGGPVFAVDVHASYDWLPAAEPSGARSGWGTDQGNAVTPQDMPNVFAPHLDDSLAEPIEERGSPQAFLAIASGERDQYSWRRQALRDGIWKSDDEPWWFDDDLFFG